MIETLKSYLPIIVISAGLVASGSVAQFQLAAHAEELTDLELLIERNEADIEEIQRLLIRRQGEVQLQVQRIESEQKEQGEDLEEIILLLRQLSVKQ